MVPGRRADEWFWLVKNRDPVRMEFAPHGELGLLGRFFWGACNILQHRRRAFGSARPVWVQGSSWARSSRVVLVLTIPAIAQKHRAHFWLSLRTHHVMAWGRLLKCLFGVQMEVQMLRG